jgi:riboflavin kinase/FMN adenylyltransferase
MGSAVRFALAVGKFDALHIGHRALAERAAALSTPRLLRLTGLAEAFGWPLRSPLVGEDDRARVLQTWPGDPVEIPADMRRLRGLDAAGFVAWLERECLAEALVVGADFRCGRDRSAGVAELAPVCAGRGITLAVVEPVMVGAQPASSSRIRDALLIGDVATAATCLGRPYRLAGTVRRGDGRGRTLGFPTANLGAPSSQLPANGVYAARALLDGRTYAAALNIGVLPSIADGRSQTVEAHLIGFSGDCYDASLKLDLCERIRPEQRFTSLDALRSQIAADVKLAVGIVG